MENLFFILADTVYADLSIPFSYEMGTVYKQDIQISQQYPESIIRLEVSIKAYLSFISPTVNIVVNEKKMTCDHSEKVFLVRR